MEGMFADCFSLIDIKGIEDLDVSNVENFFRTFSSCESLSGKLDLSK